jgi:prepilin-type N-terminal cleavage/methylation domain-containing protein
MQHPALRLALPLRCGRCGFTLVEMLVVICIMAIIAAIAFGSLFGMVGHNRLLATEQLIADSVRQARHTARSTGQPAVLTITPIADNAGKLVSAQIAGTSRICTWSETFDEDFLPVLGLPGDNQPLPAIQDADPAHLNHADGVAMVVGRTGKGVVASAFPTPRSDLANRLITQSLERVAQVVRGARTDGFYLTCNVKPPSARTNAAIVIPLLMIGDSLDVTTSQCGISLANTVNNLTPQIPQYSWEIDGWVTGQSGAAVHLLSLEPTTRVVSQTPVPGTDIADPIAGGEWIEVGMLYTNAGGGTAGHLTLFIDGRPIAEIPQASAPTAPTVPVMLLPGKTVHIGHAIFDPVNHVELLSAAPIDDACLYRVGSDQVGLLPGGVVPTGDTAQGAQIVAMPDGRIRVQRLGAQTEGTTGSALTFEEINAPQQTRVEIAIDARGAVSSRYVVPGAPQ